MADAWWKTRREQTTSETIYRGIVADMLAAGLGAEWVLLWLGSPNGRLVGGASPLDTLAVDPAAVRQAADAVIAGPPA